MAVIFFLSSDYFSAANAAPFMKRLLSALFPHLADPHVENLVWILRKLGHVSEYFILAILLMRALESQFSEPSPKHLIIGSMSLTVIYAASDELHQAFVPSRTASLTDVLIDALGGIMGTLWLHRRNGGQGSNRDEPTPQQKT